MVATDKKRTLYMPYLVFFAVYAVFLCYALILDSPATIGRGLVEIYRSRSILVSDYMEIGGVGAALVNAVLVGSASILLMIRAQVKPNGAIIMAIWLMTGFALFGKNLFNSLPIIAGVWLYAKFQKEPFINFSLAALLSSTLAPLVSEIAFLGRYPLAVAVPIGVLTGVFVGFITPTVSAFCIRVHSGYLLYNVGFACGLIATILTSGLKAVGMEFESERLWSTAFTRPMAFFLYTVSLLLVLLGVFLGGREGVWRDLKDVTRQPGRLVSDFYILYGYNVFVNMGLLCAFSTTLVLALGAPLNGPTIGSILTVTGFGCFGKNLRNVTPIFLGAVISTYVNMWDPTAPGNILAILLSTGLAPIAGQFGWVWGVLTGFVHVNLANYIGTINSGLNLYNNGFAGGFVAMLIIPLIQAFRRRDGDEVQI